MNDTRVTTAAQQIQPVTAMPSLVPALSEAERVVAEAIQRFGLAVQPSSLLVTIQPAYRNTCTGWYAAERWTRAGGALIHEIALAAERLDECDPAEVLLHELVHAENSALCVRDVAGDRHNRMFKALAEHVGLAVNEKADRLRGFGVTTLGDGAVKFLNEIGFNADLFTLVRVPRHVPQRGRPARRRWECPCGNTLRHMRGGVQARCSLCNGEFVLVTADEGVGLDLDGALDL